MSETSIIAESVEPAEVEGKEFWPRAGAYMVDSLVIIATNWVLQFLIMVAVFIVVSLLTGREPVMRDSSQFFGYLLGAIRGFIYFALFEWLYGATLGKVLLRMGVVKTDGTPCDLKAALKRGLWRFIDGLVFGLIAFLEMRPPLQQRQGDKSARTLVVDRHDPFVVEARHWGWFALAALLYLAVDGAIAVLVAFWLVR